MLRTMLIGALSLTAMPVAAQDIPSPYENAVGEFGQRQLEDTLAKRRLQQAQQRRKAGGAQPISAKSQAICRDKRTIAARVTEAKARQLYALCAQAGY